MEGTQNGKSENYRYVDRVEQTISPPSYRHFTKSELKVMSSEVTTESVSAVHSTFRETAYLTNMGHNSNGVEKMATEIARGSKSNEESNVNIQAQSKQPHSELSLDNTLVDSLEQSIDRVERMLDEKDMLTSEKITVSSGETWSQTETSSDWVIIDDSSTADDGEREIVSGSSASEDTQLCLIEADRQPFMTVDPNDVLGRNDQSKKSSAFTEFLTIKQKRESFGNEVETAQFEQVLQEQLSAQKEREQREQKLMEKIFGTIPAYRADWKQKDSYVECNSASFSSSNTFTDQNRQETLSNMQFSSADWNAGDEKIRSSSSSEVQSSYHTDSSSLSSLSMAVKDLEKAVLTQGSVTEPSSLIEVERKFVPTENSENKLLEQGATLLSEKSFHDIYYDTPSYKLTLSDIWLRQRDGRWELKTPVTGASITTSSTQYNELTDEKDIVSELTISLSLDTGVSESVKSIKEFVQIGLLNEFCSFTTTRKSYGLQTCLVDLDVTSFGVKVGEIEMVVVDRDRIPEALDAIEDIAKQLEFQRYCEANLQLAI
ncbi:uncharacterized protein LOC135474968 isoform X2 [Liolophura sinensis]|uniref:uncharacterized protein LOC135474968 isoform X2 n=1 Tax=Liolophura sinensis TaxID=3198878 RepID=UPI0031584B85